MWYKIFNGTLWKMTAKADAKTHENHVKPEGIKEINDLSYIDDGKWEHLLDVYYPEKSENEKLPVIIDVHGGGWMYGDKDLNKFYNLYVAARGFCVFSMSYTLVPNCPDPAHQLREVMTALKWIKENLKNYPCDENKIMLTGDSAGGMLAGFASALLTDAHLREVYGTVDPQLKLNALALTSPVPYMNIGGWLGFYTKKMWGKDYKKKPTYNYMNLDQMIKNADIPPTFMVTSGGDFLGHDQTHRAAKDFKAKGIEVMLKDWGPVDGKELPHVFSVLQPYQAPGKQTIDDMCEFFRNHF